MGTNLEEVVKNLPDEERFGLWDIVKSVPWAWGLAFKADPVAAGVIVALPLIEIPRTMTVVLIPGFIVSALQKFNKSGDYALIEQIHWLVAVFIVFQVVQLVSRYLGRRFSQKLVMRYGYTVRRQIMTQHAALPYQLLERKEFQEFMGKISRKTYVPQQLLWNSTRILYSLAAMIGSASAFWYMPFWTSICIGIAIAVHVVGGQWAAKRHRRRVRSETHEGKRMRYCENTLDDPETLQPVVLNDGVAGFLAEWDKNTAIIKDKTDEENLTGLRVGSAANLLETIGYSGGIIYVIQKILGGGADLGSFVIFSSSYGRLSGSLGDIIEQMFWFQIEGPYIPLFRSFFELPQEERRGAAVPAEPLLLEFHDVWFRYPGTDKWILQGACFQLREGEHLALVGANAEGKSTILKLIVGLYRPDKGRITLNGIDLQEVNPVEWRAAISYVRQNMPDYFDRVKELVRYGNLNAPLDPVRYEAALRISTLSKMLDKFGAALDKVWVGKRYAMVDLNDELAIDLSGGMKNAVDLARAMYRFARLYILDEPTSNLDPEHNREFFQEFRKGFKGRTAIFISHRFSTNCHADRIVVLDQGRVVEDGSHQELMERGKRYPALFLAEAGDYLEAVKHVSRGRYAELAGRSIGQA